MAREREREKEKKEKRGGRKKRKKEKVLGNDYFMKCNNHNDHYMK